MAILERIEFEVPAPALSKNPKDDALPPILYASVLLTILEVVVLISSMPNEVPVIPPLLRISQFSIAEKSTVLKSTP